LKFNLNNVPLTFKGVGCDEEGMCPFKAMMDYLNQHSFQKLGFDEKESKKNCRQKLAAAKEEPVKAK